MQETGTSATRDFIISSGFQMAMTTQVKHQGQRPVSDVECNIGNWERIAEIGRGRWFVAYRARPRHLSSKGPADYVVKLPIAQRVSEMATQMLRREAAISQKFSHPHVQTVLVADFTGAPNYLVLPYFPGATWDELRDAATWRLLSRRLWIFRQLAEGLRALHDAGWVHGDLAPGNVYVATSGHTLLIDLGMSSRRSVANEHGHKLFMGTLNYAAPEMFVAGRASDASSDIYGLGVLLYQALSGRLPFVFTDPARLSQAHRCTPPQALQCLVPQLPGNLSEMVMRMLAKEPWRRPLAEEIVEELVQLEVATLGVTFNRAGGELPAHAIAQRVA